jgi:hypothetical protein|tara:strand:+ start:425 stop:586 length:162 start_codon:yes stop_codon:yes gene_type:complete
MEVILKFKTEQEAKLFFDKLSNIEERIENIEILLERLYDEENVRDGRGSEEGE